MNCNKYYELYVIPVPGGTQMQEDMYDFLYKHGKCFPHIFAMGVELTKDETEIDLERKIKTMLEKAGGHFVDELQAE